jgi:O-methyltransferase
MKDLIRRVIRELGYDLVPYRPDDPSRLDAIRDLSPEELAIAAKIRPFTMTSLERIAALINAVTYLSNNKIEGDIAECGVWRGGSMMAVALTLKALGDSNRSLYLFDTFEGMPPPTDHDMTNDGVSAQIQLGRDRKGRGIWCEASLEDVQANLASTGYPPERIHFVRGKVEETIPATLPGHLALLRLDTDWYESTRHELTHLYPRLDRNGVLIIDDYGHWQGAKKAVDEYFALRAGPVYLHRIDYTGRILIGGGSP